MYILAALYKFTPLDDLGRIQAQLFEVFNDLGVTGTVLLASEGINGTIAGNRPAIDQALDTIRNIPGCDDIDHKESTARQQPFAQLKVRLKREIVTMGQPDVDPNAEVGTYVAPQDWNELIQSPDVAVIDTRNSYEVAIGTFDGAVDPGTDSFRDFPAWWDANKERFHNKRIAMFCTGGIRCEKSTNWLRQQGVEDVFHLKGGILKYLEEVPPEQSTWKGDCFVFDGRVSVSHGLREGPHVLCHACRRPILPEDRKSSDYEHGVSCHHCVNETSHDDKARFRERQKQINLARQRGARHMGGHREV